MKRFISLLICVLLIASMTVAGAFSSANYINGDADRDGYLSIRDATLIQKSLIDMVSLDEEQLILADFDLDGGISIKDVTKIQKVLVGLEDNPVEPTTQPMSSSETPTTTSESTTVPPATTAPTTTEPATAPPTTAPSTTEPATEPKLSSNVKVYFSNNKNWSNVYFYTYNSATDTPQTQWPGKKITNYTTNDMGERVYSDTIDVSKYDRIIFNDGNTQQTVNTTLSKASSGFFIQSGTGKNMICGLYAYTGSDSGKLTKTTLPYPAGYNKKIWIWTPADYSVTSAQKYKTVYIMDGQNLFDEDHTDGYGGWQVTGAVEGLMANGGKGIIIVGIDNSSGNRDNELTPDIGPVQSYQLQYGDFGTRTGKQFSDFVVNQVMPYVQKNYNSSTLAEDNAIVGSSSGGLESFYIGMEHMDKFGHIGALSPAFDLFSRSTWDSYLKKFDFTSDKLPRLYIYNGNGDFIEQLLYKGTIDMYNNLVSKGYDKSKITLYLEENASHNEGYWRIVFPENLCWCFQP